MNTMEILPEGSPWPDGRYVESALLAVSEEFLEQRMAFRLVRGIEEGLGSWAAIGLRLPSGAMVELVNYPQRPGEQAFIVRTVPTDTPDAVLSELLSCLDLAPARIIWRTGHGAP